MNISIINLYKFATDALKRNKKIIDEVSLIQAKYKLIGIGRDGVNKQELEDPMKLIITFESPIYLEEKLYKGK